MGARFFRKALGSARWKGAASSLVTVLVAVLLVAAAVRFGAARAGPPLETLASRFLAESDGRPTLLYVFHQRDCATFGALFEEWAELDRSDALRAVAVGLGFPRSAAVRQGLLEASVVGVAVDFELARSAERLILGLGYQRTPVAVLLDGEGRVRLALSPGSEPGTRRWAVEVLRDHALRLAGEETRPPGPAD